MVSLEEGHGSRQAEGHNLQPRGQNQVGFICSSIRNAFPDVEFMNGKQEDPVTPIVSFMLEAHAGARQEHWETESLNTAETNPIKKDIINGALGRGYELWVRVKISQPRNNCKEDAERMENELLAK